ncbi:MAG TPA: histidine phosphatase family protein [Acidimicrobiales bacterium]|nr:histidine phosphatase family protein [Acidimicrobiales bacterium]
MRITLVRHGQAAAGWGDDLDPGLSAIGREQAEATAAALEHLGPLPIVCSPLRRCRETAAPFAARWGVDPVVDGAVGEIVSPADAAGLEARSAWLRTAMQGRWSDLGAEHAAWRQRVLDRIRAVDTDTVVHSHFIAINVVVGAALGDDRVVCFAPDNCSWTVVDVTADGISVVELGRQATTEVR